MMKIEYFILTYTGIPNGESGERLGSTFDLTRSCSNCGTGARVSGSLNVKNIKVNKDFFTTLDGDRIISESLKTHLERSNINLGELFPIVDIKAGEMSFYHLNPSGYFPKAELISKGLVIENQCRVCCQDGYFNDVVIGDLLKGIKTQVKPLELVYCRIEEGMLQGSDAFYTWEHMGVSNIRPVGNKVLRYARPLLIVSKAMKEALIRFKTKKVIFEKLTFK